jgi:hypothetical protein
MKLEGVRSRALARKKLKDRPEINLFVAPLDKIRAEVGKCERDLYIIKNQALFLADQIETTDNDSDREKYVKEAEQLKQKHERLIDYIDRSMLAIRTRYNNTIWMEHRRRRR